MIPVSFSSFCRDPKKSKVGSPDYSRGILANMPDMEAGE